MPTPPLSTPTRAPTPAPTVPMATSVPAVSAAARPNSAFGRHFQPPTGRSKITAEGTIGTTPSSIATPRPCSSSHSITPSAAARPKALPPLSTTASTWRTELIGSSRSVSRVPGAPPRQSTAPTVPGGVSTTVVPAAQPEPSSTSGSIRWWWPTRIPPTSVMRAHLMTSPSVPAPDTPAARSATGTRPGGPPSDGRRQFRRARRADVEHRAQRQPHVVDRCRPGVRVVLGELEFAALAGTVSSNRCAASRLASMISGSCRLRSALLRLSAVPEPAGWSVCGTVRSPATAASSSHPPEATSCRCAFR